MSLEGDIIMDTLRTILETKEKRLLTIGPGASVLDAVDAMCKARVGALLVTDDAATPVGIFTERDVMARVILDRRDPGTTAVAEVMTRDVVCIDLATSPEEAMRIMTERRCRHLPVVVDGKVVGMASIGDLVRWVSRSQEYEVRMLREYLSGAYPG